MSQSIQSLLSERIVIIDGAMGTMIQRHKLSEEDYRGSRFAHYEHPLKGNNDLLVLTQPQIIKEIHKEFLKAGADILETNTFNANAISMADYKMEALVKELNIEAVKLAKLAAVEYQQEVENRPIFIAAAIGPTNKTASLSPDVNNPGYRAITFDDLVECYSEQIIAVV